MYSQRFFDGSTPSDSYLKCLEQLKNGYFSALDHHSEDELELFATIQRNKEKLDQQLTKLQKNHLKILLESLGEDEKYFSKNCFFMDKTGLIGLVLSHIKNWKTGESTYIVRWGAKDPGEDFVEQEIDSSRIHQRFGVFYE